MSGMTVGTCPSIASNPVPTNWAMKMPATMDRAPSHAAIGTNARRPATCIAPIHPTIARGERGRIAVLCEIRNQMHRTRRVGEVTHEEGDREDPEQRVAQSGAQRQSGNHRSAIGTCCATATCEMRRRPK